MAYNSNPSTWISGWTVAAVTTVANQSVSFPLTSVPEMSSSEAAATTSGDIRRCWFALCEKMFKEYTLKSPADIPSRMSLFKSVSVDTATGISTVTYTSTFQVQTTGQEVQDEPVA